MVQESGLAMILPVLETAFFELDKVRGELIMDKVCPQARECIMGIKAYVPGKPIEDVQREYGLSDVIKLASNENPLGISAKAKAAMADAISSMYLYPDGNCTELRGKLAQMLDVAKEQLIFGNGSDELIGLIAQTFVNPGDEVIVAEPTFSEYEFATLVMGGVLKKVPLVNFRHDLERMADAINSKTRLIFICNPNNPTGTIVKAKGVEAFLNRVPDDVVVIFDEAYREYVEDQDYPDPVYYIKSGKENIIALRTFSKIHALAGLRIGYGIASKDFIKLIARTKEPFDVNLMAQKAALASLGDVEHLRNSRQVNSDGKKYLYAAFEKMGLNYIPTEANFIFVDLKKSCKEVFHELLKLGVIIRTGDIFGLNSFIRVTVGTKENNQRLIECLNRVL